MENLIINDIEYAWGDVSVMIFGQPLLSITAISYKSKKSKTVRYGQGRHGRSMQHGKYECDGSITLAQSEVIALNRSAQLKGYKSILDVDFDIIVKYAAGLGVMTTDKICYASFTEDGCDIKEGDGNMNISLPFLCLDIKKNIV